jgi:hypothetical protein
MRKLILTGLCAGVLVLALEASNQPATAIGFGSSLDCRLAGTWTADNGDQMLLGGIRDQSEGGTYSFRSGRNSMITMNIDGGYRLEGSIFHFRGTDQNQRQRDVSVPFSLDNETSPTSLSLHFRNAIAGQGAQQFRLRQRASC